jgi:hypothetical protein
MGKHRDKCIGCHAAKNRSDKCSLPKVDRSKWGPCEKYKSAKRDCVNHSEGTDICRRCKKNNYGCRRTPPEDAYDHTNRQSIQKEQSPSTEPSSPFSVHSRNGDWAVSTSSLSSAGSPQLPHTEVFPDLPATAAGVHPLEYFGASMKIATISGGILGAVSKPDSGGSTSTSSVSAHSVSTSLPDFSVVAFTRTGHLQMDGGLTTFGLASIDGQQSSNEWKNLAWSEVLEILAS